MVMDMGIMINLFTIFAANAVAIPMKNAAFCDLMPYGFCKNRRLGGTYDHHQGERINELETTLVVTSCHIPEDAILLLKYYYMRTYGGVVI
jgi:hypothetical protein